MIKMNKNELKQKEDLENILNELDKNAQLKFISNADVDPKVKIHFLAEEKEYCEAALMARDWEFTEIAMDLFEKAKMYGCAAEQANILKLDKKELEFYEKDKDWLHAGILAEELGMTEKAMKLNEKGGYNLSTAQNAVKLGLYQKAINIYEDIKFYSEAAGVAEKMKDEYQVKKFKYKAIEKWVYEGDIDLAAEIGKADGMLDEIIDHFEANCDYSEAAAIAWYGDEIERCIELYEQCDFKEVHTYSRDKGTIFYTVRKEYTQSRYLFRNLAYRANEKGLKKKALELYEKGKFYEEAIDIAKELGRDAKVITLYKKNKNFQEAIDFAKEVGQTKKIPKLYEQFIEYNVKKQDYDSAIKISKEAGLTDKIELYENMKKYTNKR